MKVKEITGILAFILISVFTMSCVSHIDSDKGSSRRDLDEEEKFNAEITLRDSFAYPAAVSRTVTPSGFAEGSDTETIIKRYSVTASIDGMDNVTKIIDVAEAGDQVCQMSLKKAGTWNLTVKAYRSSSGELKDSDMIASGSGSIVIRQPPVFYGASNVTIYPLERGTGSISLKCLPSDTNIKSVAFWLKKEAEEKDLKIFNVENHEAKIEYKADNLPSGIYSLELLGYGVSAEGNNLPFSRELNYSRAEILYVFDMMTTDLWVDPFSSSTEETCSDCLEIAQGMAASSSASFEKIEFYTDSDRAVCSVSSVTGIRRILCDEESDVMIKITVGPSQKIQMKRNDTDAAVEYTRIDKDNNKYTVTFKVNPKISDSYDLTWYAVNGIQNKTEKILLGPVYVNGQTVENADGSRERPFAHISQGLSQLNIYSSPASAQTVFEDTSFKIYVTGNETYEGESDGIKIDSAGLNNSLAERKIVIKGIESETNTAGKLRAVNAASLCDAAVLKGLKNNSSVTFENIKFMNGDIKIKPASSHAAELCFNSVQFNGKLTLGEGAVLVLGSSIADEFVIEPELTYEQKKDKALVYGTSSYALTQSDLDKIHLSSKEVTDRDSSGFSYKYALVKKQNSGIVKYVNLGTSFDYENTEVKFSVTPSAINFGTNTILTVSAVATGNVNAEITRVALMQMGARVQGISSETSRLTIPAWLPKDTYDLYVECKTGGRFYDGIIRLPYGGE